MLRARMININFEEIICTKFLQIATICELLISVISFEMVLYPTCYPKLIDSLNRKDLHRAFKIANIFYTGENLGVYIGIYT